MINKNKILLYQIFAQTPDLCAGVNNAMQIESVLLSDKSASVVNNLNALCDKEFEIRGSD